MARMLIDAGAQVNVRDRGGESSLDLAAWRGFAELVDLLLDKRRRASDGGQQQRTTDRNVRRRQGTGPPIRSVCGRRHGFEPQKRG